VIANLLGPLRRANESKRAKEVEVEREVERERERVKTSATRDDRARSTRTQGAIRPWPARLVERRVLVTCCRRREQDFEAGNRELKDILPRERPT